MTKFLTIALTAVVLSSASSAVMAAPFAHPEQAQLAAQARGEQVQVPLQANGFDINGYSPRVDSE